MTTIIADIGIFSVPRDVWRVVIGGHLDAFSLFLCTLVCKTFRELFSAKANWKQFITDAMRYPELSTTFLQYMCDAVDRKRVLHGATTAERVDVVRWLFSYSETWEDLGQLVYFPPKISVSRPIDSHLRLHVLDAALRIALRHGRYEMLEYASAEFNELPTKVFFETIVQKDDVEFFLYLNRKYADRIRLRCDAEYGVAKLRDFYAKFLWDNTVGPQSRIFPILVALRDSAQ